MLTLIAFFKGLGVILCVLGIILALFWGIEMACGNKDERDMTILDKACFWFTIILFFGGIATGIGIICIEIGKNL